MATPTIPWLACPICGERFDERELLYCPRCDGPLDDEQDDVRCGECGARVGEVPQRRCLDCGEEVGAWWRDAAWENAQQDMEA